MRINVGAVDRGLGAVVGVTLLSLALAGGIARFDMALMKHDAILVAMVVLVVAVARVWPAGSVFAPEMCRR